MSISSRAHILFKFHLQVFTCSFFFFLHNKVPDPSKCRAFGPGVEGCQAGGPTNFQIQACNRLGDPITVGGHPFKADVKGPFGEDLAPRMVDNNDGTYTVTYVPSPTTDVVAVTINGKHIANSPFQVPVAPDPHGLHIVLKII